MKFPSAISLLIGILGIISLFLELSYLSKYSSLLFFSTFGRTLENFLYILPVLLGTVLSVYFTFACILVFFLSLVGIFLAVKSSEKNRKIIYFLAILNSFNLIVSLLIAWLLFGLARGM